MKLFIVFVTLVASVLSGDVHSDKPGSTCVVHASDLNYYFYNTQNPKVPIKVPTTNPAAIKNTHFNKGRKTILLVHGAGGNSTGALITTVRDTVFKAKMDLNIIALDWGPIVNGCTNYGFLPVLPQLGQMVASFLNSLKSYGLNYGDLTIAGHSVAGKFLGKIGDATKGQVSQMVVLEADSVEKNHAKFVQYIKTSASSTGVVFGHASYYPNGGPNQPGCSDWRCNHWRVIDLYAESLVSKRFVAKKCDNYANYKAGKCNNNPSGIMGQLQLDRSQGIYFLYTNAKSPFARG